jgi:hypothetical protein
MGHFEANQRAGFRETRSMRLPELPKSRNIKERALF